MEMETKWTTIDLLRHSRHDWLNKIQLIQGNLALGKMDRVSGLIEEIIIDAKQEAKVSNLDMPCLAELLLTGNWLHYTFELGYEIIDDISGLAEYDSRLTGFVRDFFDALNQQLTGSTVHTLMVMISGSEEAALRVGFDFQGHVDSLDCLFDGLSVPDFIEMSVPSGDKNSFFFELTVR